MLQYIKEHGKYVEITGYENIEFDKVDAFLKADRKQTQNVNIQFFDADLIATQEHLYLRRPKRLTSLQQQNQPFKDPCNGNDALRFCSTTNTKSY